MDDLTCPVCYRPVTEEARCDACGALFHFPACGEVRIVHWADPARPIKLLCTTCRRATD